jgi:hypothetical protein
MRIIKTTTEVADKYCYDNLTRDKCKYLVWNVSWDYLIGVCVLFKNKRQNYNSKNILPCKKCLKSTILKDIKNENRTNKTRTSEVNR